MYNSEIEERNKESVRQVREHIASGRTFDWPGGDEYRDRILKLAEENGW